MGRLCCTSLRNYFPDDLQKAPNDYPISVNNVLKRLGNGSIESFKDSTGLSRRDISRRDISGLSRRVSCGARSLMSGT